jgi:hypothetical protein
LGRPTRAPASVRALGLEALTPAQVGYSSLVQRFFFICFCFADCEWGPGISQGCYSPHFSPALFSILGSGLAKTLKVSWKVCSWRWTTRDGDDTRKVSDLLQSGPTLLVPTESPADFLDAQRHCDKRRGWKGSLGSISSLTSDPTPSSRLWLDHLCVWWRKYWKHWREPLWQHVQRLRHRH